MGTKFFIAVGVLPVELLPYQVVTVCAKDRDLGLFIYYLYTIYIDVLMG